MARFDAREHFAAAFDFRDREEGGGLDAQFFGDGCDFGDGLSVNMDGPFDFAPIIGHPCDGWMSSVLFRDALTGCRVP